MMQSAAANNGHLTTAASHHHHHPHHVQQGIAPPPPPTLDPSRYAMDYAAAAANMANIAGASAVHHPHHPHAAAADHHAHLYGLTHHPSAAAAPPGPPPAHPQHHLLGQPPQNPKRNADSAGLDSYGGASSDEDGSMVDVKPPLSSNSSGDRLPSGGGAGRGQGAKGSQSANDSAASAKKTKGRVKIKMEFIDNKLRRYTTFSKRKTGIMKKAYELSTLTGTQVMLLVASETGHVYTFATRKLQPMITSDAGKALIQTCLNSPDPPGGSSVSGSTNDQRMSATGYEETELTYNIADDEQQKDDLGEIGVVHDEDDVDEPEEEEEEEEEDEEEEELEGFDPRVEQPSLAEEEEEEIPRLHPVQINYPRNSQKRSHQPNKKQRGEDHQRLHVPVGAFQRPSTSSQRIPLPTHIVPSSIPKTVAQSGSNAPALPPDIMAQLLTTGQAMRQDGTLIRLVSPGSDAKFTPNTIPSNITSEVTISPSTKKERPKNKRNKK